MNHCKLSIQLAIKLEETKPEATKSEVTKPLAEQGESFLPLRIITRILIHEIIHFEYHRFLYNQLL